MRLRILLVLLKQFKLFGEVCISDHLRSDLTGIVAVGNRAKTSTNRPDVFYRLKNAIVYAPAHFTKDVQHLAHRLKISLHQVVYGSFKHRLYLGHFCLSKVKSSEKEVLPGSWWVDHGQRPI